MTKLLDPLKIKKSKSLNEQSTIFDYIIIGAGSAGCVLANRLSADHNTTVCLLEAGPRDRNPFIRMPMGIMAVIRSNTLNWKFWTQPQTYCANRRMYWPRGRVLGGSSAINAMCYIRGNPNDYDAWAKLGNAGWSYQELLPYFKKLEHYTGGEWHNDHCLSGPLTISKPSYVNPLMPVFLKAAEQLGYTIVKDFNTNQFNECAGLYDVFQENGERFSNARAYLSPIVSQRSNLKIIVNAAVMKILFTNKCAQGIRYQCKGKIYELIARKEIILSAGSIGSPQLLLLSGIGPRKELEKHQIPIIHDLPGVGENLQDHIDIHITCLEKNHLSFSFHYSALFRLFKMIGQYFFYRQGELTSNYAQAGGFFKTDSKLAQPNMQWHFLPSVHTKSGLRLGPLFKYYGYTLMTCLLHPRSRGNITLQSNNPLQAPVINPNYFADQADLEMLMIAFKKSRELLQQPIFQQHCAKELEPGENIQTDEEIKNYIREQAETIYHPVGTCKMGNDAMAVVNTELKVHGLANLRVIDASIMPIIISGNTNAATTMIAEKGADMILQQAKNQ